MLRIVCSRLSKSSSGMVATDTLTMNIWDTRLPVTKQPSSLKEQTKDTKCRNRDKCHTALERGHARERFLERESLLSQNNSPCWKNMNYVLPIWERGYMGSVRKMPTSCIEGVLAWIKRQTPNSNVDDFMTDDDGKE